MKDLTADTSTHYSLPTGHPTKILKILSSPQFPPIFQVKSSELLSRHSVEVRLKFSRERGLLAYTDFGETGTEPSCEPGEPSRGSWAEVMECLGRNTVHTRTEEAKKTPDSEPSTRSSENASTNRTVYFIYISGTPALDFTPLHSTHTHPITPHKLTANREMATFIYTNLDNASEERYGELWSWYLESLETGAFENIVQDTRRRIALDQFVSQYVTSYDSNVLVLLLPTEDISRSPSLLTSLLSRYYGITDDGQTTQRTVTITPMGTMQRTQTSVILVRETHENVFNKSSHLQQNLEMESVFSGEIGYVPSVNISDDPTNGTSISVHTTTEVEGQEHEDDDNNDLQSIDSWSGHSSLSGASLTRASTIQNQNSYTIDDIQQRSPGRSPTEAIVRVTSQPTVSELSYAEGEVESQSESQNTRESSGLSLQPFPTMVSTASSLNHKLVLRSMLLRNLSTGETKTAIRQIENNRMGDEWMLYDDMFSMSNLQLLSLDEVVESGAMCCKFLFYALIADEMTHLSQYDTDDEEVMEHDLTVVEFDGGAGTQDDSTYPIRFVQSNTTTATTPLNLSKTNTLRTTHDSIKSEMLMHRPDSTYTAIQKSKSTPTASSIKKKKKRQKHVNTDKCVVM